jgi:hypothetical protein
MGLLSKILERLDQAKIDRHGDYVPAEVRDVEDRRALWRFTLKAKGYSDEQIAKLGDLSKLTKQQLHDLVYGKKQRA